MSGWIQAGVWIAGAIITLDALIGLLGSLNRRTIGRWRHARLQLSQLAANADIGYFTSILGAPVLKRSHPPSVPNESGLTEYVYLGLGFYVQAVANGDDRVVVYTVTMRDPRLKAKVMIPNLGVYSAEAVPVELTLGRSRLADVPWTPDTVYASVGAHTIIHRESYYLANPGNYQTLVISWNESGSGDYAHSLQPIFEFSSSIDATNTDAFLESEGGQALRKEVVMNSYGLTAPLVDVDLSDAIYGVDLNVVRVIQPSPSRGDIRRVMKSRRQRS